MILYTTSLEGVEPEHLRGFFVGWPNPPAPATHLQLLRASSAVALARVEEGKVVGFCTGLSDGVLSASIPLLEVLPEYARQGVGSMHARLVIEQFQELYMIDVMCDPDVQPFYARLGVTPSHGMVLRRYSAQSGRTDTEG